LRRVVWQKFASVLVFLAASIIRVNRPYDESKKREGSKKQGNIIKREGNKYLLSALYSIILIMNKIN
jgi:hypothetical protein